MTELDAAQVLALAQAELAKVTDTLVRDALRSQLIQPELQLRDWDYGEAGLRYPCWIVVKDAASNLAIAYSIHGHGPGHPWGLVSLTDLWFGMDAGWFLRLEDAFVNSHLSEALPIWDVVSPDRQSVLFANLSLAGAFAQRDALDAGKPKPTHHVLYRSRDPGGIL